MSRLYLNNNHQQSKEVDLDSKYINQNYPEKLNFDLDLNQNNILNIGEKSEIITKTEAIKLESKINKSIEDSIADNKRMIQDNKQLVLDNKKYIEDNFYTKTQIDSSLSSKIDLVSLSSKIDKTEVENNYVSKTYLNTSLSSKIDRTSYLASEDLQNRKITDIENNYLTKASFTLSESSILNNHSQTNTSINDITSTLNNKIDKHSDINLSLHKIRNLENGTLDLDVMNKSYIDNLVKEKCKLVTELYLADIALLKKQTETQINNLTAALNTFTSEADRKYMKHTARPKRSETINRLHQELNR